MCKTEGGDRIPEVMQWVIQFFIWKSKATILDFKVNYLPALNGYCFHIGSSRN